MPIKGMTTGVPSFPIMGKLRKGGPKKKVKSKKTGKMVEIQGNDLDYFRYVSSTHPESVETFDEIFKQPQSITVYLPYETVDENFEAWQEKWNGGRLLHRCDGEFVHQHYDKSNHRYVFPEDETVRCPGGCKQVGRLKLIAPAMLAAGHVGIIEFETHSIWDIVGLHGSIRQYASQSTSLQGVEFVLYRFKREISTPAHGRQLKWLVGIKPNHEWVLAQLGAQIEHQALPVGESVALLGGGNDTAAEPVNIEDDIEEVEFTEEPPAKKSDTGQFHAAGMALCNNKENWDNYRPKVVKAFSGGRVSSSNDMNQDEINAAIKGMAEKKKAVDGILKLDEVFYGLYEDLESKGLTPLFEQPTKKLIEIADELKGSEPAQPELIEGTAPAVQGAHS